MMKKVFYLILVVLLAGVGIWFFVWNKPHRNIADEAPAYNIPTAELIEVFVINEKQANEMFLDKVVVVEGDVLKIEGYNNILLTDGVHCTGTFGETGWQEGEHVYIKGRVIAYDELFKEVKLDNCIEYKP